MDPQSPKLEVIDSPSGIESLLKYLEDKDIVTYDIETTGLNRDSQIIGFSVCAEETLAYYVILHRWNPATSTLDPVPDMQDAKKVIQALTTKKLVCHNAIFDCSVTEVYFKVRLIDNLHTDTMVLAHLLDENRRVGLKDLAKTFFGENSIDEKKTMDESIVRNGGKVSKSEYELYKGDAYLIAKYGAQDALLTYKLFLHLVPELYEQGLDQFFYEKESMPLLRGSTYQLNTEGLKVDIQGVHSLKKQLEAECAEANAFIYQEIAPYIKTKYPGTSKKTTFNVTSNQQLSWLLFGQMKMSYAGLTKEGKVVCKALGMKLPYTRPARDEFIHLCQTSVGRPYVPEAIVNGKKTRAKKVGEPWKYIAVDKKILKKLSPNYKWIEKLLEYQSKSKILDTYLSNLEEKATYGVIRPSFLQHGTTSGRYSSRSPNFQNLPRDDKRVKQCIIARPGKVFVGADYSQLEPRVFACVSGDKNLLDAFKSGEDFYSVIGARVYGKTDCTLVKDDSPDSFAVKYKRLRDIAKVIALASTYGATPFQLAPTMNKSIEETAIDMAEYFENFPDVADMMKQSHKQAKEDGQVVNIFGRPRRIPEAKNISRWYGNADHADLPYDARKLLNLAVNHRIQSTAASIVNRSAIAFEQYRQAAGIDCKLVVQVHDSLIVECNEADAENVVLLLQEAMENTVDLKTIKLEAIPKIGRNLAEV